MNGRGHTLLTVASDSMAVKSGDWSSEGPLLYKACGTLGHNDPFVVALLKGRVPQQTLWPISNPFTEPHAVRDHRRECKKTPTKCTSVQGHLVSCCTRVSSDGWAITEEI